MSLSNLPCSPFRIVFADIMFKSLVARISSMMAENWARSAGSNGAVDMLVIQSHV